LRTAGRVASVGSQRAEEDDRPDSL
jgi:hypothetical protein